MPEGSWKCEKCNNINYPFRTKCNRQNCGAERPAGVNDSTNVASEDDDEKVCCYLFYFCHVIWQHIQEYHETDIFIKSLWNVLFSNSCFLSCFLSKHTHSLIPDSATVPVSTVTLLRSRRSKVVICWNTCGCLKGQSVSCLSPKLLAPNIVIVSAGTRQYQSFALVNAFDFDFWTGCYDVPCIIVLF